MITQEELTRSILIYELNRNCNEILRWVKDRMTHKSQTQLIVAQNLAIINKNPDLLLEKYVGLVDGDIQKFIVSNVDENFLIGYNLLVAKGVITP